MANPKRGAPKRPGILARVPCRFENAEQYRRVISQLTIDRRGAILFDHATRALQTAAARPPAATEGEPNGSAPATKAKRKEKRQ